MYALSVGFRLCRICAAVLRLTFFLHAGLLLLNMVISIISEGLCEILDNDLKDEGAPRHAKQALL